MRVFLLHRDQDFRVKSGLRDEVFQAMHSSNLFAVEYTKRNLDLERQRNLESRAPRPGSDEVLTQDLELETLWRAMAAGDEFLFEAGRRALLSSLSDSEAILYRQQVLADCLEHPGIVRQLYALALEALDADRTFGSLWSTDRPDWVLSRSVNVLKLHVDVLKRLRQVAEEHAGSFRSEGFTRFFAMLREELPDEYLQAVEQHLRQLEFKRGVLASAGLGKGFKGRGYTVRAMRAHSWRQRLPFGSRGESYSFQLHPRDEIGFKALDDIRGRSINQVANAVAQSADHVKSFFALLRVELAFYLGCLNLHARLTDIGEPICFPDPAPPGEVTLTTEGVCDVSLALHLEERTVGNDIHADRRSLVVITGANQGGKSTLLRGLGLAQLMMQAGMFVAARSFRANVCTGIFTHYRREEDVTMESGKLDEELRRMSDIAEEIRRGALLLCNESFASTNEREGSEIARQIVRAMLNKRIKILFVTHMYDLARSFYAEGLETTLFLRAERRIDGSRTFRLLEGEPLPTSYGEDSYRRIFNAGKTEIAVAAETKR